MDPLRSIAKASSVALIAALAACSSMPTVKPGECPAGTELMGHQPPTNDPDAAALASLVIYEQYCVKKSASGDTVREGPYVRWYPSGKTQLEGAFHDGKKDGLWTLLYESGKPMEEVEYKDDLREGKFLGWFENGVQKYTGTYHADQKEGTFVEYFENGQKYKEIQYRLGKREGEGKLWASTGELRAQIRFKDDRIDDPSATTSTDSDASRAPASE